MARVWTCRNCKTANPRTKQRCPVCAGKRPAPRKAAHNVALEAPYEEWVERFGERCGICGAPPRARRLHRDHDHSGTGKARGLLCFRCNAALRNYMTEEWLEAALAYVRRAL